MPYVGIAQNSTEPANNIQKDTLPTVISQKIIPNLKKIVITTKTGIEGIIKNTSGIKLTHVNITARKGEEIMEKVKSDNDGRYEFNSLSPGIYELEYSFPNYLIKILVKAEVVKGRIWNLPITLYRKNPKTVATHETVVAPKNIRSASCNLSPITVTRYYRDAALDSPHWFENAMKTFNINTTR